MAKHKENAGALIFGGVRMLIFAFVFAACIVTFAVGFSLGWFNINSSVTGSGSTGVDIPDVSLAVADCTGRDPANVPAADWRPYSKADAPVIAFNGMVPGAARTVALRVVNESADDQLFYSVALAVPTGGETPDGGHYLGTQIKVTAMTLPGFYAADGAAAAGETEIKTGGFLVTDTALIAPLTVAENIVVKASSTAYIAVTLTFVETGADQNAFMNFGGKCARYFELTY